MREAAWRAATIIVLVTAAGCGGSSSAATLPDEQAAAAGTGAAPSPSAQSPLFVAHAEHIPAGFPFTAKSLLLTNPYEGNARATAVGGQLFVAYNCVDCHGADGSGSMGPSLADGRWHFGGAPAEVFESIYQGRPDGMPAWGGRIADDQIWMLVTYVRSLRASADVSSDNFTGKTVERTGH